MANEDVILDQGGAVFNVLNSAFDVTGSGPPDEAVDPDFYHNDLPGIVDMISSVSGKGGGEILFASLGGVKKGDYISKGLYYLEPYTDKNGLLVSAFSFPPGITLAFVNGAKLVVAAGTTITLGCPIIAGLYQIFETSLGGKVVFKGNTVPELYPQWWGARGDPDNPANKDFYETSDDGVAIQAALDAVPTIHPTMIIKDGKVTVSKPTQSNRGQTTMSVVLPPPKSYYLIRKPLTIDWNLARLAGMSPGVRIRNIQKQDYKPQPGEGDVIHLNTKKADEVQTPVMASGKLIILFSPTLENLDLCGTVPGAIAVQAENCGYLELRRVDTHGHQGISLKQFSTPGKTTGFSGCNLTRVVDCEFEGCPDFDIVLDDKGSKPSFRNVTFRGGAVGLHMKGTADALVSGCSFEGNGKAILAESLKKTEWVPTKAQSARTTLTVEHTRFEGNGEFAIDVDPGFYTIVEHSVTLGGARCDMGGVHGQYIGGTAKAFETLQLGGGGRVTGHQGGKGTRIMSSGGRVDVTDSANVYGRPSEVRIAGALPPFTPLTENRATSSWFDDFKKDSWEVKWEPGKASKASAETFYKQAKQGVLTTYDGGFLGTNSARVTFFDPWSGNEYLVLIRDMSLWDTFGAKPYRVMLAFWQATIEGRSDALEIVQSFSLDKDGDAGMHVMSVVMEREWQVAVAEARAEVGGAKGGAAEMKGTTYIRIPQGVNLRSPVNVIVGAMAAGASTSVGFLRTGPIEGRELGRLDTEVASLIVKGSDPIRGFVTVLTGWSGYQAVEGVAQGIQMKTTTVEAKGARPGDTVSVGTDAELPGGAILTGAVIKPDWVRVTLMCKSADQLMLWGKKLRVDIWQH